MLDKYIYMKIAIITYDCCHLKTEQVLNNIAVQGYDISVFALRYKHRTPRDVLFSHRPDQSGAMHPFKIASYHGFPYQNVDNDYDIPSGFDYYLILGAGIMSADFVQGKKIINCHPGIIPSSRGLDSFKWAIYHKRPLGITLHYIDENVDSGEIISIISTPVCETDTIERLSRRHYDIEIGMLSNFEGHIKKPVTPKFNVSEEDALMRMPIDKEREMLSSFERYVNVYSTNGFIGTGHI